MLLTAIIAFLIIFSLLILVHELGHFAMARFFGVKVEEFGLGLPPKAKTLFKDKHKTEYTLNWLPLGGFVRMKGEDSFEPSLLRAKDSFAAKPVYQRMLIALAGVTMNYLTGLILLILVFTLGTSYSVANEDLNKALEQHSNAIILEQKPLGMLVEDIVPDSPADSSELRKFDFIAAIDGEPVNSIEELRSEFQKKIGQVSTLSVKRREYQFELPVTPDEKGEIGIMTGAFTSVKFRYPFLTAIGEGSKETVRLTGAIAQGVGNFFLSLTHGKLPADIGGPVAIAQETYYRASDVVALLTFAALLAITLAFFNILPIPALDGGRLLFLLYEALTRRRPNPKIEARIHLAGYFLLLGLIAIITVQDILR